MKELISVIVPVYNTGEELIKCIESIVNNTYKNLEIIIVDDGSKAETAQLCDMCCERFQNVTVFHRENKGVSESRNFGLENCNGEYIMFVDSDDLLKPNAIEILYNLCIEYNADFTIGGYTECINNRKYIGINVNEEQFIWENNEILYEFLIGEKIGWNVWAKLYRKNILKEVRFPIGKRTAEDMFFIYKVCKVSSKAVLKCVSVYDYIKQPNSTMADSNCKKFFDTYEMIKSILFECKNLDCNKVKSKAIAFYIKYTVWFLRFILAKDRKRNYNKEIMQIRKELLDIITQYGTSLLPKKTKIESYLIINMFLVFKIYSILYSIKIRNS